MIVSGPAMNASVCRFEGCVNVGDPATFAQDERQYETRLCSGHVRHVYESLNDPTKLVQADKGGRIRVLKAPPIHDHESEKIDIIAVLDIVAERELKRHMIEPHGTWADDTRAFICIPCNSTIASVTDLAAHLNRAVDDAIAAALKAVQHSKD